MKMKSPKARRDWDSSRSKDCQIEDADLIYLDVEEEEDDDQDIEDNDANGTQTGRLPCLYFRFLGVNAKQTVRL